MATGTISTTNITPWQLISTTTTTSGTSHTLTTGLSGYGKLMIAWNTVTLTTGSTLIVKFNGTTTNYASAIPAIGIQKASSTAIVIDSSAFGAQPRDGYLIINDVLSPAPKTVNGMGISATSGSYGAAILGSWNNTSAITSIVLTSDSGTDVFTAGTVTLYGIAA